MTAELLINCVKIAGYHVIKGGGETHVRFRSVSTFSLIPFLSSISNRRTAQVAVFVLAYILKMFNDVFRCVADILNSIILPVKNEKKV